MAITGFKIPKSKLSLDWSHLNLESPGRSPEIKTLINAWESLKTRFNDDVGFFDAPISDDISQIANTKNLAKTVLDRNTFTDCLFLGIGGSALGPISASAALLHLKNSPIQMHFVDNPDPIQWNLTLQNLNPETTLVCAVTKSGGTFETISQLMIALEWLGRDRWESHLVGITDPKNGQLREFCSAHRIPALSIHPTLGGRFSEFSPVGLFPLALEGHDPAKLLEGANSVRKMALETPVEKNPLFTIAESLLNLSQSHPNHVCMPYSTRLKCTADWWVQLWGESLGKNGKGFTPIGTVGATDQHSVLQLLRDGPNDKITFFIVVDEVPDPIAIPKITFDRGLNLPTFDLLQGQSLHRLLNLEYDATSKVLTQNRRPSFSFRLDAIDAESMGSLYFSLALTTAFLGTLMDINPFDQPGVEEGKIYLRQSLSQMNVDAGPIGNYP